MTSAPVRRLVGTDNGIAERIRIYQTAEALEIDQLEYSNIRRRRVFFDEVGLVTLHSKLGVPVEAVFWGVVALFVGISAAAAATSRSWATFLLFALGSVLALGRLVILLMPQWTVTVFGKRTRARIRFRRRGTAHRVYDELCRTVAAVQDDAARRYAAQRPQPPPLPPMPPSSPVEEIP